MKKFSVLSFKTLLMLFLAAAFLLACNKEEKPAPDALDKDTSYAFGMFLANFLSGQGLHDARFDYGAFTEGFKAFLEAQETRLTPEQAMEKINAAFVAIQAKGDEQRQVEGEKNQKEGEAFLAENGMRSGVVTTSSGLQYEVVAQGSGEKPTSSDTVRVHYEGTLIDGTVFDSSYNRGEPAEFPVGGVIQGWVEGVQLMNVGSTYRFVIPPNLAYGPGGNQSIPPNATLVFKVELLSIVK